MQIISFIYLIGALIAISASVPQVVKLFRTKHSGEFQLSTWVVWTGTQATSLLYVASLGNVLMIGTNIAWVSFYGIMSYLIYRYRPVDELATQMVQNQPKESPSTLL